LLSQAQFSTDAHDILPDTAINIKTLSNFINLAPTLPSGVKRISKSGSVSFFGKGAPGIK